MTEHHQGNPKYRLYLKFIAFTLHSKYRIGWSIHRFMALQ